MDKDPITEQIKIPCKKVKKKRKRPCRYKDPYSLLDCKEQRVEKQDHQAKWTRIRSLGIRDQSYLS